MAAQPGKFVGLLAIVRRDGQTGFCADPLDKLIHTGLGQISWCQMSGGQFLAG
jgi:hypothetical protein